MNFLKSQVLPEDELELMESDPIFVVDREPTTSEYQKSKELNVPLFIIVTSDICPEPEDYKRFEFCLPPLKNLNSIYLQKKEFIPILKNEITDHFKTKREKTQKIQKNKKTKSEEKQIPNETSEEIIQKLNSMFELPED